MFLEIGNAIYTADTSAMTALRYRVQYGASALVELSTATELSTRLGVLAKLAAVAAGIDVKNVAVAMRHDEKLIYSLGRLEQEFFGTDPSAPPPSVEGAANKPFDELDLLAVATMAGLSADWWYELPIMYISSVVARMSSARGKSTPVPTKMSSDEVAAMYNISPERLRLAQAAQEKTAP